MRILHVHSGNIFGGVERILVALAGHKNVSPDIEHFYALCYRERLARELEQADAMVFTLPEARISKPIQTLRARRELQKLFRYINFDIVVVHSAWAHALFASVIRAQQLPLAFWLHTQTPGNKPVDRLAQLWSPDGIISVSKSVDASAWRLFPEARSCVVYAPLPIDEGAFEGSNREKTRAELGVGPDDVVILQASRMEAWKGHRELFQALALLRENSTWVCWVAGGVERADEQEYFAQLKRDVDALALNERVRFLGRCEDIPALLTAADIYCQPNLAGEGFSIAFLEACYARLPIVTSALGGAPEIVSSDSGMLAPPRDITALAAALLKLICAPEVRKQLGAKGRQRALERCDPVRQFQQLEHVFQQIIARHG